jgi:phenylacetate-CoA ligase
LRYGTFSAAADISYGPPLSLLRSLGAYLAYPVAESLERRTVSPKLDELRRYYRKDRESRSALQRQRLREMLEFAVAEVPYYRDLFASGGLDPSKIADDPARLADVPLLTKAIIMEQGERMLSRKLSEVRHHAVTTGGSTGRKATLFYDQEAADYSSAVTAFARGVVGAGRGRSCLHFAAELPATPREGWPNRETLKCLAMNRSNIFFAAVDEASLEEIWQTLRRRRPYLVHGHPSTLYALADYVRTRRPDSRDRLFHLFESSGEVLHDYQARSIREAFGARTIDRYGLAEFGVIAYQFDDSEYLDVLDSEVWIESQDIPVANGVSNLVVTGLRNRLMPLLRYDTGDLAQVSGEGAGVRLQRMVGRQHDVVAIDGVPHLTHFIQDVMDHRVRGIKDFQIDTRTSPPVLRVVLDNADEAELKRRAIESFWPGAFRVEFVGLNDLVRVGWRSKFRHVVTA